MAPLQSILRDDWNVNRPCQQQGLHGAAEHVAVGLQNDVSDRTNMRRMVAVVASNGHFAIDSTTSPCVRRMSVG